MKLIVMANFISSCLASPMFMQIEKVVWGYFRTAFWVLEDQKCIFHSFSDPPVRVELDRKWKQFVAGEVYNVSCRVMGSRPPAQTSIYIGSSQLRQINYQVSLTTVTSYHFLLCCTLPLSKQPFISPDVSSSPLDGQLECGRMCFNSEICV